MDKKIKYDEIIPLGYDCTIARQLDNLKYRRKAYPFDWLVTINTDNLIECIINNFDNFYTKTKDDNGIFHNVHGMVFLHHSHFNIDEFNSEFDKKIRRFNEILLTNNKILLIRKLHGTHEIDYCNSDENNRKDIESISKLRDYIDTINPNNNIDITTLISCENCCSDYKDLLSDNEKLKVEILYEPNGDDNDIYKDYLRKNNEL